MKIKHVFMFVLVLLMGVTLFADVDVGKVSVDAAPSFIYDADSIQDLALESIAVMAVETSTAEMGARFYFEIEDNQIVEFLLYESLLDTTTDKVDVEMPGFMPRRSSVSDFPGYMNIHNAYEPVIPKFCSLYRGSAIHRTMRYRG